MQLATSNATPSQPSRRDFLKAGAAAGAVLATHTLASAVYAAGSDQIKVGLVGCSGSGRGTGAAMQALKADPNAHLVALADVFPAAVEQALNALKGQPVGDRVQVDNDHKFTGFDGYKGVIASADVVLLADPPHFRPLHLRAAVDAGRHVFCEKPVAVDVPGTKKVIEACKVAKEKNLCVVAGLPYRYDEAVRETVQRVHGGAIGAVVALQGRYNTAGMWMNPRQPGWSDMEWQLRNWRYFTWLGGDFIVEQYVHTLDKMLWLMNEQPPASCTATGGRTVRTGPEYGNIYDHFDATFEWPGGVRAFCQTRQWVGADQDLSEWALGASGRANLFKHMISDSDGVVVWQRRPSPVNMYDAEHVALFKAIRSGTPINDGDHMTKSTLMGIMGRFAAYTGKTIYWSRPEAPRENARNVPYLMESKLDLTPPRYELGPMPAPPVAVPGQTKFI